MHGPPCLVRMTNGVRGSPCRPITVGIRVVEGPSPRSLADSDASRRRWARTMSLASARNPLCPVSWCLSYPAVAATAGQAFGSRPRAWRSDAVQALESV